jgi:hypothetical protein
MLHDRQVPQATDIVAMDPRRDGVTIRAARLGGVGPRRNEECGIRHVDVFYGKTGQDKGQDRG